MKVRQIVIAFLLLLSMIATSGCAFLAGAAAGAGAATVYEHHDDDLE